MDFISPGFASIFSRQASNMAFISSWPYSTCSHWHSSGRPENLCFHPFLHGFYEFHYLLHSDSIHLIHSVQSNISAQSNPTSDISYQRYRVWLYTGFGLMTRFITQVNTARDYTLQFTIICTTVHSHVFTAVAC
jgi:hypothetical protein